MVKALFCKLILFSKRFIAFKKNYAIIVMFPSFDVLMNKDSTNNIQISETPVLLDINLN